MVLHFEVTKDDRKAMVQAIVKELNLKPEYQGVPSCAYRIGAYEVSKEGTLTFDDSISVEESSKVIDACVMATGKSPTEWEENMTEEQITEQAPGVEFTVTLPIDKVNEENLKNLLGAKGGLIKKALGIEKLDILTQEDTISFPWFAKATPEEALAYTKFIAALCEMSKNQKRISSKAKENENEKYAFRCFLLRLGFIGDEFKADRKILLSKLEGSSAFKNKEKGGEQ